MKKLHFTFVALGALLSTTALAAPDEVQVYTDEMNAPGEYGVELHLNYVPQGSTTVSHPGELQSNHRFQAEPEFSYGINPEFEAGLYVPVVVSNEGNVYATGLRPRLKYIHQQADGESFFWGLNTEFGYSTLKITDSMWNMELRPIIGSNIDAWTIAFNPIVDIPISKGGMHTASFEPALMIKRKINEDLALGIEHYSNLGPISSLQGWGNQEHTTYVAADFKVYGLDINLGIGHGYQKAEDDWVIKSIVAFPFN